jgi:hypothetical protein
MLASAASSPVFALRYRCRDDVDAYHRAGTAKLLGRFEAAARPWQSYVKVVDPEEQERPLPGLV